MGYEAGLKDDKFKVWTETKDKLRNGYFSPTGPGRKDAETNVKAQQEEYELAVKKWQASLVARNKSLMELAVAFCLLSVWTAFGLFRSGKTAGTKD